MNEPRANDLEGWLSKMTHSRNPLSQAWNRRWFRFDNNNLRYFRSRNDYISGKQPSVRIALSSITSAEEFDGRSFIIESTEKKLFLRADSPAEQTAWLNTLQDFIQQRRKWDLYQNAKLTDSAIRMTKKDNNQTDTAQIRSTPRSKFW
eukprot:CAMPEP_0185773834 /NCGR_PEP_ID=MMETSP1174-20130828/75276_1 /TAXON_ID=35687 /ORGANISM="Dictyocha speculum, Strain CCMP1381" /LENGTH=147 /DNA_ID=CAMNT_0028460699 /DNA_START=97 /DNA_END=537 /DNA_ORIENTATION=+